MVPAAAAANGAQGPPVQEQPQQKHDLKSLPPQQQVEQLQQSKRPETGGDDGGMDGLVLHEQAVGSSLHANDDEEEAADGNGILDGNDGANNDAVTMITTSHIQLRGACSSLEAKVSCSSRTQLEPAMLHVLISY